MKRTRKKVLNIKVAHLYTHSSGHYGETSDPWQAEKKKINKLFVEHGTPIAHEQEQLSICTTSKSTLRLKSDQSEASSPEREAAGSLSVMFSTFQLLSMVQPEDVSISNSFQPWPFPNEKHENQSELEFVCEPDGYFTYPNIQ